MLNFDMPDIDGNAKTERQEAFLYLLTFAGQFSMSILSITVPIYAYILGASPILIGLIGGAGSLVYSLMPLLFGILSDKLGRKKLIVISMILHGSSAAFYRGVANPVLLVPLRAVEWSAAASFWPSIEALIVDSSRKPVAKAIKIFNVSWGSAVVIGPFIAGSLISVFNPRFPFLVAFCISITLGILSPMIIREERRIKQLEEKEEVKRERRKAHGELLFTASSILLFSFAGGIIYNLFPAFAVSLAITPFEVGVLILMVGLARVVAFFEAESIERKVSKSGVFILGSIIVSVSSLGVAYGGSILFLLPPLTLLGFAFGMSYATAISCMLAGGERRGSAAGAFESMLGIGYFMGSIIGGAIAELSQTAPYILASALGCLVFTAQLIITYRWRTKF
ncbi:MFS transporter [Candidatus Bathyarchaeota archaeon]|nr:MAG: MFS transporter [Candidatus Bathyarchaeota archaeon]